VHAQCIITFLFFNCYSFLEGFFLKFPPCWPIQLRKLNLLRFQSDFLPRGCGKKSGCFMHFSFLVVNQSIQGKSALKVWAKRKSWPPWRKLVYLPSPHKNRHFSAGKITYGSQLFFLVVNEIWNLTKNIEIMHKHFFPYILRVNLLTVLKN